MALMKETEEKGVRVLLVTHIHSHKYTQTKKEVLLQNYSSLLV